MSELSAATGELERLLRLRTKPLGMKFCESADEIGKIENIKVPKHPGALCQFFGIARIAGKTIGLTAKDVAGAAPGSFGNCASIFGLSEPMEFIYSGQMMAGGGYKTLGDSRREQQAIRRVPTGKYEALILGPVDGNSFLPDVVAFYGTPGQMMMLINGIQHSNYEPFNMRFVGESSCSDAFVECFLSGRPTGSLPCMGERQRGGAEDNEMVIVLPPDRISAALEGVIAWNNVGTSYPVLPFGTQCDPTSPAAVNVYPAME